jgi:outer membrane protein OmpA-like peptidoglycan-associated protein
MVARIDVMYKLYFPLAFIVLGACSHFDVVKPPAITPANEEEGYFLDHDEVVRRGGVGNIAPMPPVAERIPSREELAASAYEGGRNLAKLTDDLRFDRGSTAVKPQEKNELIHIADLIAKNPEKSVVIEGFTDSSGSPKDNKELSTSRALSVKSFLISRGVRPGQISTFGFGDDRPIAPNNSDQGRAKNRRVELYIFTG